MSLSTAKTTPAWWEAVDVRPSRQPLTQDIDVDILIVGAGMTGLWTAYYLSRADPTLSIAVIEQRHVGFGASGRNGGWCHGEYPLGVATLASDHGPAQAARQMRALYETVDEVRRVTEREDIDCHYAKGGVLTVARSELQLDRAREDVAQHHAVGLDNHDLRLLTQGEAIEMLAATNVLGGTWSPHGAAIQPALLTHGLASACERRDVTIYEQTPASSVQAGSVTTEHGTITAAMVVQATEGFTAKLKGQRRRMAPLYSHMVATEPLTAETWSSIGLEGRPTFGDFRNLIIYGQRTADDRLAFGGRGAPYHFGSAISDSFDANDRVHTEIVRVMLELFPVLEDTAITHRWGGALGAPRDWRPAVSIDRAAGIAVAGGYVGDGVASTNLAGRTLSDLITESDTDLTTLPWVDHEWRKWEPEPLRWAGINAGLWMAKRADAVEERRGTASKLGEFGNWLRGKTR